MQRWRLGTTAFVSFGALATLIATIGLFGIISFSVVSGSSAFVARSASRGNSWFGASFSRRRGAVRSGW